MVVEKEVDGRKVREDSDGNVTTGLSVSDMPLSQFLKWEMSCKRDFGDCYWMKMVSDHEKARAYDRLLIELEKNKEVESKEDVEEEIHLLGGGDVENGK